MPSRSATAGNVRAPSAALFFGAWHYTKGHIPLTHFRQPRITAFTSRYYPVQTSIEWLQSRRSDEVCVCKNGPLVLVRSGLELSFRGLAMPGSLNCGDSLSGRRHVATSSPPPEENLVWLPSAEFPQETRLHPAIALRSGIGVITPHRTSPVRRVLPPCGCCWCLVQLPRARKDLA